MVRDWKTISEGDDTMNIYDDAIRLIRKRTPSANNSLLIKTLQTAKALQVEHEALKKRDTPMK